MKRTKVLISALAIAILTTFPASAEWKKQDGKWWYQNEDGSYPMSQWKEIDGKQYYFDSNGYMLSNTYSPDDKQLGEDGAWTGIVKTYVQREQEFLSQYRSYLDSLIFLSQSNNHVAVMSEMGETQYQETLKALPKQGYCYPYDNGVGIKIQDGYLYFGSLENGASNGNGIAYNSFWNNKRAGSKYAYYSGEWKNDAPNGYGIEYSYSNVKGVVVYTSGNYTDWYQDGDMTSIIDNNNKIKTYHYKVKDKFPVAIGKLQNSGRSISVVSYEETGSGYLTFYDTAQTAAHIAIDDGIKKNSYGYYE